MEDRILKNVLKTAEGLRDTLEGLQSTVNTLDEDQLKAFHKEVGKNDLGDAQNKLQKALAKLQNIGR